jgi:hypothetical protein
VVLKESSGDVVATFAALVIAREGRSRRSLTGEKSIDEKPKRVSRKHDSGCGFTDQQFRPNLGSVWDSPLWMSLDGKIQRPMTQLQGADI